PGCAFKAAAETGAASPERLAFLQGITDELLG
ncbi:TPA: ribosome small subunit-dependent GTPase, partial [Neisseria gonorrhoeae]